MDGVNLGLGTGDIFIFFNTNVSFFRDSSKLFAKGEIENKDLLQA